MIFNIITAITAGALSFAGDAPADSINTDPQQLNEVVIRTDSRTRSRQIAMHTERISSAELKRAACCNLGESFSTNPSVDVSYADAATGAKQLRLLGLSGQYVQMLTENVPNFRGAAAPYALGYVAGPWMQSIQVSKGAASVKNGYEATTGQINIEFKKPQADGKSLAVNGYIDQNIKAEANVDGNIHIDDNWSTALLLHGENAFRRHDGNGDGFADVPSIRQFAAMNRWAYMGRNYVFQAAARYVGERREGGEHHAHAAQPYRIDMQTHRGEFFTKNALIFDHENDGNVALIVSGNIHNSDARYGFRRYDERQRELYAQAMFERKFRDLHSLSVGASVTYDHMSPRYALAWEQPAELSHSTTNETVAGAYAQYTLNYNSRWIVMGGLRYDHNSLYGNLLTPRMHVRYNPTDALTFNASVGLGRRSPHPLADFSYILASSRKFETEGTPRMEKALNAGASAAWNFKIAGRKASLSADYYYTRFSHQTNLDLDASPHLAIVRYNSRGLSHAVQLEATYYIQRDLHVLAAYRRTHVLADNGQRMVEKALTPSSKSLLTASWEPRMGLWQIDLTLAVTGGGRMPEPDAVNPLWDKHFSSYCTLNAQVTRNWRHWAVYVGGENLTNYRQHNPIIGVTDPYGPNFDATLVHAPLMGAMVYAGFRYHISLDNN